MLEGSQDTQPVSKTEAVQGFESKKNTIAQQLQESIKAKATEELVEEGEPVKVDALPKEEEVIPPKEDDDFTNRMSLLARKERMIMEREQKIKDRERIIIENEELRQRAKKDPRSALKELGWEYEQLMDAELNDFKPPEKKIEQELLETVTALKAEIEALKTKPQEELEAFKQEQFENGVQAYKRGTESFVKQNADKYKYINKMNGLDTVVEVAKEIFKNEKYEPTYAEACDRVEAYLRNETKKYKEMLLSLETDDPIDHNESIDGSNNSQQQNIKLNSSAPRTLSATSFSDSATQAQNTNRSFEERKRAAAKIVERIRQAKA